ncbi:hypothetical protein D9758_014154 [Tetrapyrgos nigripes]|uniref:Major facilitator superfamily (MFS) profile domain-containing protein n=1 Tax=Tetrapyrgos nigripes TaxID=182062 RepID=A0A8H5CME4_9AGAR|nr:hypothetical protein D9758_014154 [Tetrapyrgos nigripes]
MESSNLELGTSKIRSLSRSISDFSLFSLFKTGNKPEIGSGPGIIDPPEKVLPDGGLKGWSTVFGAWCVGFGMFGYMYSFGVYQDFYVRYYLTSSTPSSIAWIGSVQTMMPLALGMLSGRIFDKGGFYAVEIVGCLLFTFSVFMLSLAKPDQYYQIFLSQGVGMGFGLGLTYIPTMSVLRHYFKARLGLATGLAASSAGLGGIVFPIMLNQLLPKIGFGPAVRASGYLVLGCTIVGLFLMRTDYPPKTKVSVRQNSKSFLLDARYIMFMLGALITAFGSSFPAIYIQLYSIQHHVEGNISFYSIAIINGSSIFGRIIGSHFADTYGPLNVQICYTLVTGAAIWGVLGIHDTASLVVISIIYGIASGALLSLTYMSLASLAENRSEVGALVGLGFTLSSLSTLASAPVQGALLGGTYEWIRPIVFSATMTIGGTFFFLIARMLQVKKLNKQRV